MAEQIREFKAKVNSSRDLHWMGYSCRASGCAERELHLVVFQVKTSSDEVHLIAENGKFILRKEMHITIQKNKE